MHGLGVQFFRHMAALLLKRYQYFKRDLKGFLFLVLIPVAVVLAIVALLKVSLTITTATRTPAPWYHPPPHCAVVTVRQSSRRHPFDC